jgi:hypothetical protein
VPDWPRVPDLSLCTAAALDPAAQDGQLAAAAHKVAAGLTSSERELLAIPEYAAVMGTRIALEIALAEGARLFTEAPAVNQAAFDALASVAESAAGRLQPLEEKARDGREVEKLRLFASASTALHRELQAFRDLAVRLRSAKAVPRSVALDPATARPPQAAPEEATAPPRGLWLSDFISFDRLRFASPGQLALFWALIALFFAATVRAIFFSSPRVDELQPSSAEIAQIRVSGGSAMVTVHKGFKRSELPSLLETLRAHEVTSAAILRDDSAGVGQLDVKSGQFYGIATDAGEPDAGTP